MAICLKGSPSYLQVKKKTTIQHNTKERTRENNIYNIKKNPENQITINYKLSAFLE